MEVCDLADNDCDGAIDEGFTLPNGVYAAMNIAVDVSELRRSDRNARVRCDSEAHVRCRRLRLGLADRWAGLCAPARCHL